MAMVPTARPGESAEPLVVLDAGALRGTSPRWGTKEVKGTKEHGARLVGPDLLAEAVVIGAGAPPPHGRPPGAGVGGGRAAAGGGPVEGPQDVTSGGPGGEALSGWDLEGVPDEALARRAGLGDKAAFAVLVDRHGPGLHRHVSRMLRDRGAVEDCLQETLIAAWKGLRGFRGQASVRTWLFTIARRQVFAHGRRVPESGSLPYVDPAEVLDRIADLRDDPARTSVESGLLEAVDVALTLLPERQRSAWLLKEVEGLSYAEIAIVLDVGPTVVRGLLARARTTLASTLEDWR
ncbi:RNA polymerase sigma factor [Kineococcus sp. R86509]|uniref:RNA polymerase sigma factor n=1 Tax=Kineococcus sp. R86509 TaxID=3093851 RepID=UPI0036D24F91